MQPNSRRDQSKAAPSTAALGMAAAIAVLIAAARATAAEPPVPIKVAGVPSISTAGLFVAIDKGYFREAGLDVEFSTIESGSDVQAMLATNRVQVISGALSAAMFNSMAQNLPVKIYYTVATGPSFHYLMVRSDLKDAIRTPADLKGRIVAVGGKATGDYYSLGRVLESVGLSMKDIDARTVVFSEMPAALANKALDIALMIPPLTDAMAQKGIAVKWLDVEDVVKVKPMVIAVGQMNTDWVRTHEQAAKGYLTAVLKGTREYCQAFHFGPNRPEIVKLLAKYTAIHDPALIDRIEWGASDPIGSIPRASLEDFEEFDLGQKLISKRLPLDQVAELDWVQEAGRKLGPFTLIHDDGKPGCR
jgi:NitT/TauT family transport system substrate-binding protein